MPKASTFAPLIASQVIDSDSLPLLTNAGDNKRVAISEMRDVVGLGWGLTINAARFPGITDEQKIQAAIDHAVNISAQRVTVPMSMIPYDASVISFDMSVQMIREGGDPSTYDVQAYGAAGDGVVDDTASVRAAIAFLPSVGGIVYSPAGYYRLTDDLSAELNSKRHVVLKAANGRPNRGNGYPPVAAVSVWYVRELTDYLFTKSGGTLESLRFEGMAFDASNGLGGAFGSTTCPGIVAGYSDYVIDFSAYNCLVTDFAYSHRPGANLPVTSITSAAGVATLTSTVAHGLLSGEQITVSGAVQAEYNITATITVTGSSTLTYPISGTPASPATGADILYKATANRAVFDGEVGVHWTFDHCFLAVVEDGRMFFTGDGSTTFAATDCYISGCREVSYHRTTQLATYTKCIFESSVVTVVQYMSNTVFRDCFWENVGADLGGAHAATGIAPRKHGLVFGGGILSGLVVNAIQQLYGSCTIDGGNFQYISSTSPAYSVWLECIGAGTTAGNGGSLCISRVKKGLTTETLFASTMAFGAAERSQYFNIEVYDSWGVSPLGAIRLAVDMRKVNVGITRIEFSDGNHYVCSIKAGAFIMELQDPATSLSGTPTAWPQGDAQRHGDTMTYPIAAVGQARSLVCYSGGQPGLWAPYGFLETLGTTLGDVSVTLQPGVDHTVQHFGNTLTANRTCALSSTGAVRGSHFRIVRNTATPGAFTLDVGGGTKVIPANTNAWVDVMHNGSGWILTGYGVL